MTVEIALVLLLHVGLWLALQTRMPHEPVADAPATLTYLLLPQPPVSAAPAPGTTPRPPKDKPRTLASRAIAPQATLPTLPRAPELPASTTAPANLPGPAPLDLEGLRRLAIDNERNRPRKDLGSLQDDKPATLTMEQQLGQQIARAARKDCKSAYSGLGLLAVIPLAVDAFRESGCKW